ncbi:MAG: hypothetical protein KDD70_05720 [Bdellovibrionales bacterium]|nr:hypothetical protein [Bdellovibrionales bacterium]
MPGNTVSSPSDSDHEDNNSRDLSGLSRRQKRLKDWSHFLETEVSNSNLNNSEIRVQLTDTLKLYRNLIAKCWESESISRDDSASLTDLERQLEQLTEDARLLAR